jgi:hypothetical protein
LAWLAATYPSSSSSSMENSTCSIDQNYRKHKEAVSDVPIGQGKQSLQQFHLKVDGQMKDSFATFETAEKTGLKIKTAHPVVQVSVYDSVKGAKTIITPGKNAG